MKMTPLVRFAGAPLRAALLLQLSAGPAAACAFCNADQDGSKMSHAADTGIVAMVVIMLGMLVAIGGFIWRLAYLAKHPLPDYSELLREDGPGTAQPEAL